MVWNTNEEAEIMGRKRAPMQEPGPGVMSHERPFYTDLPGHVRIQMPLTQNRARMLRMVEELRGLANQIAFCVTRADLHPTWQLHQVHMYTKQLNRIWLEENKSDPHRPENQQAQKYTKSGNAD